MGHPDCPLWSLSARELSQAYARGLSPAEVITATLARIEEINPQLNAIVTLDAAGATASAEASARRWKAGRPLGPFDGVPVTIKDNILAAGLRATWGSRLYRDFVPDTDETPVARLREAGAVILGKTNVPEFTLHGFTDNELFGVTGNPWNTALTPGGSSGGAVAAVASGMGALALGTDGGGSIRRPAAHAGLVGFKPSREAVPRDHGFPAILHNFEVAGPIARCVDDVISAMDIIAGTNWSHGDDTAPVIQRPRIAYAPTFGGAPVDPLIRDAVARTIAGMGSLGLDVEMLSSRSIWPIPWFRCGRSSARPGSPGYWQASRTGNRKSRLRSPIWLRPAIATRPGIILVRSIPSPRWSERSTRFSHDMISCSRLRRRRCHGRHSNHIRLKLMARRSVHAAMRCLRRSPMRSACPRYRCHAGSKRMACR